jgi:AbiV family abortive infection protein
MNEQLFLEWSKKAATNSSQLAIEARTLFDAKHFARAYYLCHMSTEESSKSILLHSIHKQGTPISELSKINLILRDHKKKIEFIVMYAEDESKAFKAELKGLKKQLISHLNNLKNNSMYVSCEEGLIVSPEDTISGIDISVHLTAAEALVHMAKSLLIHDSSVMLKDAP